MWPGLSSGPSRSSREPALGRAGPRLLRLCLRHLLQVRLHLLLLHLLLMLLLLLVLLLVLEVLVQPLALLQHADVRKLALTRDARRMVVSRAHTCGRTARGGLHGHRVERAHGRVLGDAGVREQRGLRRIREGGAGCAECVLRLEYWWR